MNRPIHEIADIIKLFGVSFNQQYQPNEYQKHILKSLVQCRTAILGGHKEQCDCCGEIRISYNSCGNRHCPKCQSTRQAFWIEDLTEKIIPVKHYHIVFTVPHELNSISLLNSKQFYNSLFASAWDTLRTFGYTKFGVESGAICVLHTWGQNLSLHPHIHCIVPAAGFSLNGKMKNIGKNGKFLFPVKQLSAVFRGKLLTMIKKDLIKKLLWESHKSVINETWKKPWNINCKPSFGKPENVIKYLGQYTHRVAISNNRILGINSNGVSFMHKDYRNEAKQKPIFLSGVEFLRRFCQHILPKNFVKIRYYGIYSSRFKAIHKNIHKSTIVKHKESSQARLHRLTGFDIHKCPYCNKGKMQVIDSFPKIRSPSIASIYNIVTVGF